MEEIKIKQIEVFGRRFEIIKSSFRNPCNECELYNNCYDESGTFIADFCSQNLTYPECFKLIVDYGNIRHT